MYTIKKSPVDGHNYYVFDSTEDAWSFHDIMHKVLYGSDCYCYVACFGAYENAVRIIRIPRGIE